MMIKTNNHPLIILVPKYQDKRIDHIFFPMPKPTLFPATNHWSPLFLMTHHCSLLFPITKTWSPVFQITNIPSSCKSCKWFFFIQWLCKPYKLLTNSNFSKMYNLIFNWKELAIKITYTYFFLSLQACLVITAPQMPVSISTVVWGSTVWWTMRPARESASVWSTASRTTNPYVDLMENSSRTTVSCTEPRVWPVKESPLYTAKNASTKVRKMTAYQCKSTVRYLQDKKCPQGMRLVCRNLLSSGYQCTQMYNSRAKYITK